MSAVEWAIVLLLPPAAFGIMILVTDRRARRRQRQWDLHTHQAMRQSRERHPTAYDADCGRPGCGVCELHRRRRNG